MIKNHTGGHEAQANGAEIHMIRLPTQMIQRRLIV